MASVLRFLPRWLRERLILPRIVIDDAALANVSVKVAKTRAEVFGSAQLVHDVYVARGILTPHVSRLKLGPQLVLPSTFTFVATVNDAVVGTISLVADSPLGLPMDASFRREIDEVRARGERIGEVTALAVAPEYRRSGLVYLLNRLMIHTAIANSLDRVVMTVHPRAEALYETAMLFERLGDERSYVGLNESARAVAMGLPVAGLSDRLQSRFGSRGPVTSNPRWTYFDMPAANVEPVTEALAHSEERIESMEALARARMDVFRSLSDGELAFLRGNVKGVLWPSRSRSSFDDVAATSHGLAGAFYARS